MNSFTGRNAPTQCQLIQIEDCYFARLRETEADNSLLTVCGQFTADYKARYPFGGGMRSNNRRMAGEVLCRARCHAVAVSSGADLIRDGTHNPGLGVAQCPADSAANLQPATHCNIL
jgi:hypothetical protein